MFCKYCGKEIADDSVFCQYCGKQLEEQVNSQSNSWPFQKFISLGKRWQIAIMLYLLWFLVSICLWIGGVWYDWFDDRDGWITEIMIVLIIPMLVLFNWYYFKRLRNPKAVDTQENKKPPVSLSLVEFSKQHGKMQVKTVANPTTNEVRSFCVFINEQGKETIVEFGKALGVLRPQEIAEKKEQLKVVQLSNGSFELIEKTE